MRAPLAGLLVLAVAAAGRGAEPAPTGLFAQVRAIFAEKCLACHGKDPADLQGKYDLRTRAAALAGGESDAAAVVPGQPEKSRLLIAVMWNDDALQMPPKANDRLSAEQIEVIRRWIAAGAEWDESAEWTGPVDGVRIATSGGQTHEWTERKYEPAAVWAYRVAGTLRVPSRGRESEDSEEHPVDAFLLAKLREAGIDDFASPADPRTLLRRVTFDLTGLPPTEEEIDKFLHSFSPTPTLPLSRYSTTEAVNAAITRLLASPHYGERQAQHWLDVVRYADTAGFSNDFERPHAWRYRDYVVRSFNADKPFDRFITEQIAGDELDADDPELLIAAGYLRMGPWEHTGMTVAAMTRQQFLDDVTHHVGVSLLAQGLRCCACHDHKFDPLPTRDYYRMQAIFAPVQFAERPAEFLPSENIRGFGAARALVESRLEKIRAAQTALKQKNQDAIAAFLKAKGVGSLDELPESERPKQDFLGGTFGLSKTDLSLRKVYQKSQAYLERELKRFEPFALSVYSGPPNNYTSVKPLYAMPNNRRGDIQLVHILSGGSLESPGEVVEPGVLSALAGVATAEIPTEAEGRRLALARWITSPRNPLTARAIVNRVWQQHFGRGLVATSNNFGKMGSRPTHPELLDWLAAWLVEHDWSLKELHKLIVTSRAYQQRSNDQGSMTNDQTNRKSESRNPKLIDPANRLLWHFPPRRLSAEEIRDASLAASGELNREIGGPGVFPEIHWEVALQPRHIMGSVAPAYIPSRTRAERNRRTLYAFRIRTLADPALEVLNRPGSDTSCERRDETTVTPQVFALFNSEQAANRALAMADRLTREHYGREARVAAAFRLVYAREPSADEVAKCVGHIARMTDHHRRHPPQPTQLPTKIERGMVEELTGEMVHWEEDLSVLAEYQRDLLPWEVDSEVRALADVCLVLLNSNEFLYVR
jgi:mono/diheme cytochrome c family protein